MMDRRTQSHENMQQVMNQTQQMSLGDNVVSTGVDPFMSSTSTVQAPVTDPHIRQESADSGVGMGSNFNLGSIPEDLNDDMDSAMDVSSSLDTTLTAENQQQPQSGPTAPEQTAGGLMPSLPSELDQVLMQDVLGDKNGTLTWL